MLVFQPDLDQTINVIQKENSTIAWKKKMFTDSPQHLLTSCRCWDPNEACTCIPILKWTSLSCAPSNQTHESIQFFHFMPMASSNIICALWGLCIKGDATKRGTIQVGQIQKTSTSGPLQLHQAVDLFHAHTTCNCNMELTWPMVLSSWTDQH
jgi:hypothetical protein